MGIGVRSLVSRPWGTALAVVVSAALVLSLDVAPDEDHAARGWWSRLGQGLQTEPFFADESAYIAHTFYYRLLRSGDWNHPDWLHPAAYDSPPFFKYLMGFSLQLAGYQPPASIAAAERWYQGRFEPPENRAVLTAARRPMFLGAVAGCVAIFVLGQMSVGTKTGWVAAGLLVLSPLYFTHARRAMADDLTQACVMASLAAFASAIERLANGRRAAALGWSLGAGLAGGLAVSSKLNGVTALLTLAVTGGIMIVALRRRHTTSVVSLRWSVAAGTTLALALALALFLLLNPFFYARPVINAVPASDGSNRVVVAGHPRTAAWVEETRRLAAMTPLERLAAMFRYRSEALDDAIEAFPAYMLPNPWQRLQAIVLEGLGRWSAGAWLAQDASSHAAGQTRGAANSPEPPAATAREGATTPKATVPKEERTQPIKSLSLAWAIPLLLVLLGCRYCWIEGRTALHAGRLPVHWMLLVWPALESLLLLRHLTLNWDRYYLGIVAASSLLMAVGLGGTLKHLAARLVLAPPSETPTA